MNGNPARGARVLIVDDEPLNRELLEELLSASGHHTEIATDGLEALAKLSLGFDVVLLDVMMPGIDGFEVARRIREGDQSPNIPILMVTSLDNRNDRLTAVRAGANDYVTKPIDISELTVRLNAQIRMKEALDTIERQNAELERTVEKRTSELRRALADTADAQRRTESAHLDTIQRLSIAAEYKDEDTAAHIRRMAEYSALLARTIGMSPGQSELIRNASCMHDVGKIGIPDRILLKPGKLDGTEWGVMRSHTTIGERILGGSASDLLEAGRVIAASHHEKWDGSGYPAGLAGEAIPLTGRICAVADVFDAFTSERPYKRAFTVDEAVALLMEGRGAHFEPRMVDAFLDVMDDVLAIREREASSGASAAGPGEEPPA